MRQVYLSGQFVDENEARISIFDRGFLMADAVYEGIAVLDGKLCDLEPHLARLSRSLNEMGYSFKAKDFDFITMLKELVAINQLEEGFIYLQVTRGETERDFVIADDLTPNIVAFTQAKSLTLGAQFETGIKVVTREDLRWGRCDVKTTQLLWASLMKTEAIKAGADDVWLERDGVVLEGSSNNAFIVTQEDAILTRPNSREILPGITRRVLLELCERDQIQLEERFFTVEEATAAKEAFVTAASSWVVPVVSINNVQVGDGKPGPISEKLRALYVQNARATSI